LEFDADKNIFTVIETERPTELYVELLHDFSSLNLSVSTYWRDRLSLLHPLDREIISTLLSSIRDWLRNQKDLEKAEITESPVIFMRNRGGWTSRAADDVLKNLALRSEKDLPAYLLQLAGADIPKKSYVERYPSQSELVVANETADVLFSLPANLEQLQLAKTIEHKDIILVQGPPGTGKTHTIANLLGHLLSQGKRVLVTSHTSKALKVLRDKVPTNIQSLCVSVLDNVSNNKKELEQSVEAIAQKMEQGTIFLEREAKKLEEERASLLSEIQKSRKLQQSCVHREYESIVIGGESISPIDAAKEVDVGRKIHDWIPGPLEQNELGKVCSVSVSDLMWIYSSQKNINQDDEITLRKGVLSYTEIRKPIQFNEWIDALDKNREITKELSHSLWNKIKPKT
jgi:DNA-directed RNA polymerase subunit L